MSYNLRLKVEKFRRDISNCLTLSHSLQQGNSDLPVRLAPGFQGLLQFRRLGDRRAHVELLRQKSEELAVETVAARRPDRFQPTTKPRAKLTATVVRLIRSHFMNRRPPKNTKYKFKISKK